MIKRAMVFAAFGLAAALVSTAASARVDVGVYLGVPAPVYMAPAPVYVAPPPVVYAPSPPVVYAPPPVYYGGYRQGYWGGGPRWHDHGRHRGWEGRHHHGRW